MSKASSRNTRLMVVVLIAVFFLWSRFPKEQGFKSLDRVPNIFGPAGVSLFDGQMTLQVTGSPRQIGTQHGMLLGKSIRAMLDGYILDNDNWDHERDGAALLEKVRRMRPSLPDWYLAELEACAKAADVDEDLLLLAQCEGDIRGLAGNDAKQPACSGYAAFDDATSSGSMRAGRNFDYAVGDFVRNCAIVTYVTPDEADGHPFIAVGWTGILGGWTLINREGLIIANHLGGGPKTNPAGIPTLILTRILAQKASTVDEAITMLKSLPRMRGQIIWLAQGADASKGRPPRAVAVEYDAETIYVRGAPGGVLVVTNKNLLFGSDDGVIREPSDGRYAKLKQAMTALKTDEMAWVIAEVAGPTTLHCVELFPKARRMFVAHGYRPAQSGKFVEYHLRWDLSARKPAAKPEPKPDPVEQP